MTIANPIPFHSKSTTLSKYKLSGQKSIQPSTLLSKVIETEQGFMKFVTKFGIINTWIECTPNRLQITEDMNVLLDTTKTIRFTAACKKALDQ